MLTPADVAVVDAARAGDRAALAELLAAHLALVYNVVGRALDGHPDVDDVVQETMLRVVQSLPTLRDPTRFRSWLVAIAMRQIQDRERHQRAGQQRHRPLEDAADAADPGGDFVNRTINRLDVTDEREAIRAARRWLGPRDRSVLALWWQESAGSLTRAEVADALGLSVSHAAVAIFRMRTHLNQARAVLAAWQDRPRCAGLADVAGSWDRRPDARWLKRLHRHVRACAHCEAAGRSLRPTEQILGSIGPIAVPVGLLAVPQAVAAPTTVAVTAKLGLTSRLVEYLSIKPALTVGTAVAGAAAILGTILVDVPAPLGGGDGAIAAPPSAPATAPGPTRPTIVDTPSPSVPASPPPAAFAPAPIYLSPAGSDTADGSIDRPYATLNRAISVVQPGQTIYLRGGVYRPAKPVDITVSGTSDQRITLTAYEGERPVLDTTDAPSGRAFIIQQADYWTIRGLEIVGAGHLPYVCESCRYNVFQGLSIHDNLGTGFTLRGDGTVGNQILDSDFFNNHDPGGSGADGLAIKFGSGTGNVIRGCRTYHNVDDGVELTGFEDPVTIDQTWSYGNGVNRWSLAEFSGSGNGFRLAGGTARPAVAHIVTRSAAWKNGGYGFTESGNAGALRLTNNTAFRNVKDGFAFFYSPSAFQGNLALGNNRQAVLAGTASASGNSWNESGWNDTVLRETDPASAEGPRRPDGSLPDTTYLTNLKDPDVGAPMG